MDTTATEFDDQITELVCEMEDEEEYLSPLDWPEEWDIDRWELGPEPETCEPPPVEDAVFEPTTDDLQAIDGPEDRVFESMMDDLQAIDDICGNIERRIEEMLIREREEAMCRENEHRRVLEEHGRMAEWN